jgi:hypothetical protein
MTSLRAAALLAAALASSSVSVARAQLLVADAPASYRAPNRVLRAPVETAAAAAAVETEPMPIDVGARVRDEALGGLLGFGIAAAMGCLLAFVAGDGDEEELTPVLVGSFAPAGLALGTWLGGEVNGGSRFDGALVGVVIGSLVAVPVLFALATASWQEDPAIVAVTITTPWIGSIVGAELASALSGVRF